jgi:propanediol dehydratase large subunit
VQHKLNLIDNDEFDIATAKDKSMNFIMVNSGRQYFLNNKDVVGIMDYDLIDRLIRGISIDTERSQKVFHHLIDKK